MALKKLVAVFTVVLMTAVTAGCQTAQNNPKQTGGAVLGGVAGGLAGSAIGSGRGKLVAVGVGTLLGALLGSEIGRSLDEADRAAAERNAYSALESTPTGQSAQWRNPDSGNYGYTTPTRTYQNASGQNCRDYQTAVVIQGRTETARGTACRQPDGSWRVVS